MKASQINGESRSIRNTISLVRSGIPRHDDNMRHDTTYTGRWQHNICPLVSARFMKTETACGVAPERDIRVADFRRRPGRILGIDLAGPPNLLAQHLAAYSSVLKRCILLLISPFPQLRARTRVRRWSILAGPPWRVPRRDRV